MQHNFLNQNPLLNHFNGFMTENSKNVPFRDNQLINNNVHVMNNLNESIQHHRANQQNINKRAEVSCAKPDIKKPKGNVNIIEEMLKPVKVVKNNKDVSLNYKVRETVQEDTRKNKNLIKITNMPYKTILKDKIIKKNVEDVEEKDFLVHKSIREIDADVEKFKKEYDNKEIEKKRIYDELKIEFHIDNYDRHKSKFDYKESFIKNQSYNENTFDENKQDYIEFYKQKQREAEEGKKMCDQILHFIDNDEIISKNELPTNEILSDEIPIIAPITPLDPPPKAKLKSSGSKPPVKAKNNGMIVV